MADEKYGDIVDDLNEEFNVNGSPKLNNTIRYLVDKMKVVDPEAIESQLAQNMKFNITSFPIQIPETDDTARIKRAIARAGTYTLHFPEDAYFLSGTGTEILLLTKAMKLTGDGIGRTQFIINSNVPNTTDVVRIAPTGEMQNFIWDGIDIVTPTPNTPPARHAIHIDLTAIGSLFKTGKIKKSFFNAFNGKNIKLTNPTNIDGFFTSCIEDNTLYGGIEFERCGDSISIVRNTITGQGVGIKATAVSGTYRMFISENNITSKAGAIDLTGISEVSIKNNQIEQTVAWAGVDNSVININGGQNIIIEENNIDNNGFADHCIKVDNTRKISIDKNQIHTGANHIKVGSGAKDTFIGYKNVYRKDGTEREKGTIVNAGIGTTNVDVSITLQNGWLPINTSNHGVPRINKSDDGIVTLFGQIASGTATADTQLFLLPEGYRPKTVVQKLCYSNNGSAPVIGSLLLVPTGEVLLQSGSNVLFSLEDICFKAESYLA